ncbi:RHS repeat domain-containing protein [Epilithonimonas caeni]|uniref:hypothetical protein n=1 Tax=Epilithonimonas caeni TaxID=365343 RepID=UPI00040DE36C|nr:hypothetical protein [Epilithonimonas caeni]
MKKRLQLSLILLFTIAIGIKAQDEVGNASNIAKTIDMYPKTPEAAALSQFVDIPAGNFTGVADFSIPIYTIEFDGQQIPIALRYTTTGIKVDQIATRVGLGWVLDTGPSLSVQVIGNLDLGERPDIPYFNPNGGLDQNDPTYILAGRAAGVRLPYYDGEPDIFTYRLLNTSGKYILDRKGVKGTPIPYNQISITGSDYRNNMDIIDEQGFRYIFNNNAGDIIRNKNSCISPGQFTYDTPSFKTDQIISPKNEKIKYVYSSFNAYTRYITSIQTQVSLGLFVGGPQPAYGPPIGPSVGGKCINYADSNETGLTEIQFNGGKVLFTYSNKTTDPQRLDLPGEIYLKGITVVNDKGQVIKDFTLQYDHFPSSDPLPTTSSPGFMYMGDYIAGLNYRLKLTGVTDNLTNGKYVFDYYGNNLPIRTSNDQDFWGVYNGANNGTKAIASTDTPYYSRDTKYLRANKEPNINYGKIGNLKRITYPTGGYTNIEYEADNNGSLTTTVIYDYHTEDYIEDHYYDARYDYSVNPDLTESTFYIPEKATNKSLSFSKNPPDGIYTNPYSCKWHLKNLDTGIQIEGTTATSLYDRTDIAGNYRLYMDRGGDYPPQKCTAVYMWDEITTTTTGEPTPIDTITVDTKPLGTIRVKKIESFDQNNGKITREYTYRIPTENHVLPYLESSGVIHGDEYFNSRVVRIGPSPSQFSNDKSSIETLVVNNPGWQISSINGKPIAYTFVQEHYKDESHPENSYRKEYEFINTQDYDLMYSEDNATSLTWSPGNMENGLLKEEILFNSNNQKVKETYKSYLFDGHFNSQYGSATYNDFGMGYGLKIYPASVREGYGSVGGPAVMYNFNYRLYTLRNTWIREDSTRVRDYVNGTDYIETLQVNNYSIPAYKHTYPTESVSSGSGNTMKTTFRYPQDVSAAELGAAQSQSVLNSMLTKNLLSTPLIVKSYKNGVVNSEVRTFQEEYNTNVSGTTMILPEYIYVKKGENAAVEDRKITFDSYDTYGNLTQYTLENGIPVSVVWGYNKTMPIAKVEGALLSTIPSSAIDAIVNASNTDNNPPLANAGQTEQDLVDALDTFRKGLSSYQVTTYSYDPLIGVRCVTPPSGQREYYTYDDAGRLQEVKRMEKDGSGNEVLRVLKKNEYHYKD